MRVSPVLALAFVTLACAPDPTADAPQFADGPLSGLVGGEEWELASGGTDAFLSDDDGLFSSLYGTPQDDVCAAFGGSDILITIPLPGDQSCETDDDCRFQPCVDGTCEGPPIFRFGSRRNLTFVIEDEDGEIDNLVATNGAIRIDSVEDDVVTGAIKARFNDDNDIDGTFEVTICADDV